MARIKGKHTRPEMAVRRLVHGLGYRYRLHGQGLPGRPDIVLKRRMAAIFVHGCFWHQHPESNCRIARMPKSRLDFWGPKLASNRARDARDLEALERLGWRVLIIWECELRDMQSVADRIRAFLGSRDPII
jgi:DNA mismatch endonuclease (patch repair protein)